MGACLSGANKTDVVGTEDGRTGSKPQATGWLQQASRQLEQTSLIFAIDFTSSNVSAQGSFGSPSLHAPVNALNSYEEVMSSLANAVYAPGRQCLISAMGFGDASAQDMAVFSFFNGDAPARSIDALLSRYRELVPCVRIAGLASFAPAIYQGMRFVVDSRCQHHTLIIITSGQVTRPQGLPASQLSRQEQATINAIVAASELPLSIIVVGVGDGPWEGMQSFCEKLPERRWNNFCFVLFLQGVKQEHAQTQATFAEQALSAVPAQIKVVQKMGLVGCSVTMETNVRSLPPPSAHDVFRPAMSGALLSNPSDGSDGTASSLAQQRSATAFERWAEGSQGGKSAASQGLIYPKSSVSSVPSPFSTWVSNNMPRTTPNMMEPLPEAVGAASTSSADAYPPNIGSALSAPHDYAHAATGPRSADALYTQTPPTSAPLAPAAGPGPPLGISHGMDPAMLQRPWPAAAHIGHGLVQPIVSPSMGFAPVVNPGMHPTPAITIHGLAPAGGEPLQYSYPQPLQLQLASDLEIQPVINEELDDEDIYYDPQFICPLSGKLMNDPVMACDGYTYDRASITEWLLTNDTSPETKQTLPHKELTPNYQLKASIDEFLAAMQQSSSRRP